MGVFVGEEDWWVCLCGEELAPSRVVSPSCEIAQYSMCCIVLTSLLQIVRAGRSLLHIPTVCMPSCMCRRVTEAPLLPEASLWSSCFSECTSA